MPTASANNPATSERRARRAAPPFIPRMIDTMLAPALAIGRAMRNAARAGSSTMVPTSAA